MQDIIKSIKAYLYDRSSSPLLGAYVCSWLVWNYQLIIIIFSSEDLSGKFIFISEYWREQLVWGTGHFIMPALLAVLYIFVYPFIAKPVYKFSLGIQRELREIKQKQESEMLLSVEESRQLRVEIASLQEKYLEDTHELQKTITSQTEEIKKLEKQLTDHEVTPDNKDNPNLSMVKQELISLVNDREEGRFSLNELYGIEKWSSFSEEGKKILSTYLEQLISSGKLKNIKYVKMSGSNKIYEKIKGVDINLNDDEKNILVELSKLEEGYGKSASELGADLFVSTAKIRLMLDKLESKQLIEEAYQDQDGHTYYKLTIKGLRFLDTIGLLD